VSGHAEALLQIFLAFTAARLLGHLFQRFKLPAVVGELLAGALLGPYLLNILHPGEVLDAFAELGVIMLLFMAGLETHIEELVATRAAAIKVAVLGAALPFISGALVGLLFGWGSSSALFMATALTATSVGITVRVVRELKFHERRAMRIILAAAVLDDVLGLIVLVIVSGMALGELNIFNLALLIVEAIAYVGMFSFFGPKMVVRLRERLTGMKVATLFEIGVILTLALSLLADYIGLAAIVGAFIAGLTMSELRQHTGIVKRFEPLAWFFTPFFFVLMGTYLDFAAFAQPLVLLAVVVFTALAVVTKYIGGVLGARREGPVTAREVGAGMVPRGEVGIVVAGFALAAGAVSDDVYAAMLGMVLATTILAPFIIKWVFRRGAGEAEAGVGGDGGRGAGGLRYR
jgi:Kef-type K+ transport system membrane component KefB